eukprot:TRINITY_DN1132_c0_g1_i1.p2 TRINITY_DN1132_c0_g1~~TRINITY_DN1132_c0_g1_i1.p2  ORF type:complete len:78 (+),score=7.96 TRINITY_DN1132_c0_g1_i1:51-284(+)
MGGESLGNGIGADPMDSPMLELRDSSQLEKVGSAASSELYSFEPGSLPNVFYSGSASSLPSPPDEKKRGVGEGKGEV